MTKSGEPTFGVPMHQTVIVKTKDGTLYAAYHDGDTWYEGHYDAAHSGGVQIPDVPVELYQPE
jgi:hypothetical protein